MLLMDSGWRVTIQAKGWRCINIPNKRCHHNMAATAWDLLKSHGSHRLGSFEVLLSAKDAIFSNCTGIVKESRNYVNTQQTPSTTTQQLFEILTKEVSISLVLSS